MAHRRARREAEKLEISSEQSLDVWDRHGYKVVFLKKKAARKPFNYQSWLHQKAGEQMAEDRIASSRLEEIWNAVIIDEMNQKWLRELPYHKAIKAAPRIRGCGRAAARADSAT